MSTRIARDQADLEAKRAAVTVNRALNWTADAQRRAAMEARAARGGGSAAAPAASSQPVDPIDPLAVSFTPEEKAAHKMEYNYSTMDFPSEEGPGLSVFCKDASGEFYHTYSVYARGLDILVGTYNFLDLAPKGRDEAGLKHSMAWVRHHDKY